MKKIFGILLALMVSVGAKSVTRDVVIDGINYDLELTNQTATVAYSIFVSYSGEIVIPSYVVYNNITYAVTAIEIQAFYNCTNITSITIPSSVKSIGSYAFYYCTGLESATINSSLISESMFSNCYKLSSVTIGSNVTSIGRYAFEGCSNLFSLTVPNTVTTIDRYAFDGVPNVNYTGTATGSPWGAKYVNGTIDGYLLYTDNSKTTVAACNKAATGAISLPNSVTTIQASAFKNCKGITNITLPNSITSIGGSAFYGCTGLPVVDSIRYADWYLVGVTDKSKTSYNILSTTKWIAGSAFSGCTKVSTLTIPNTITQIGSNAFQDVTNVVYSGEATGSPWGAKCVNGYVEGYLVYTDATKTTIASCALEATGSIAIPSSVTTINSNAFYNCSGITGITLPNTITSIGSSAFYGCTGLPMVDSIRYADWYLIEAINKKKTSYAIKAGTKWIADQAFSSCSKANSITIPAGVITIGSRAFRYCSSLASVTIPSSVTTMGTYVFENCTSLESATINSSLIGSRMFSNCSKLSSVTIGSNVTSIGTYAFDGCSSLFSLTVPKTVTSIKSNAFYNIPNVKYTGTATGSPWGAKCINGTISGYLVYSDNTKTNLVCCGKMAKGAITIPNSVTSISEAAFSGCDSITSVSIPNSVTSIGNTTFLSCSSLTSVTLSNNITYISPEMFSYCVRLISVTIPNSVTSIGNAAFYNCKKITSITIPSNVTTIDNSAFAYSGLKSVTIPSSVTSIGSSAFRCDSLTAILVNANNANYCSVNGVLCSKDTTTLIQYPIGNKDTTYVLPNSVTTVGNGAFRNANYLTSVVIGENVATLKNQAFYTEYLRTVTCRALVPPAFDDKFSEVFSYNYRNKLYVPVASLIAYQNSAWKNYFSNIIGSCVVTFLDVDGSVIETQPVEQGTPAVSPQPTEVLGYSFAGWSESIANVTSNMTVTPIYTRDAFDGLYFTFDSLSNTAVLDREGNSYAQMTHIVVPKTLEYRNRTWTVIGVNDNALADCMYLQDASFPSSLLTIGQNVFTNCYSLASVTFTGNVPYGLNAALFSSCVNLTTIYVPCGKTNIFRNALSGLNVTFVEVAPYICIAKSSNEEYGTVVMAANYSCPTSTVTLTATANSGYRFDHWNDGNTQNPRTVNVTQDVTYTAYFVEEETYTYTVTAYASPANAGSVNVVYSSNHSQATMTATANSGYHFEHWNDGNTQNPRTITLTQDVTCTAYFEQDYTPVVPADVMTCADVVALAAQYNDPTADNKEVEMGNVTIRGYVTFAYDANGGQQSAWMADTQNTNIGIVEALYASITEAVVKGDYVEVSGMLIKYFKAGKNGKADEIILEVKNGTMIKVQEGQPIFQITTNVYPENAGMVEVVYSSNHSQATMTAIGNTGYHFKRWNGGNTENPRTVVLTQDTSFTAIFELNEVYVTYIGMDGKNLGVETVAYGKSAKQTGIDADEFGYTLTGWDKDLSSVTENMTVTAIYRRDAINGFYYIFDRENRTAVLDREGNSYANIKKLNVPNHFIYRGTYFAVVAVGANAFEGCTRLTDVVLPGNVEDVFESAFSGCSDMVHLTVSAGLRSIADYAFNGCKRLEDITVYAERVPDLTATSFNAVGNKKYINVYVPDNRVNNYKRDDYWSEFNIVVKSAEIVEETVENVAVQPEETTAQFTWPTESSAGSYTIQITKDGEVFCTLIFNANGQLTGIAFAPGRDGNRAPAATMTANGGMQFTVTGLDAGTTYAYTVTTKDTNERVIATYEGSFETNGTMEDGIEDVQTSVAPKKVVRDGQIYILRGEKVFTLQGMEVK